MNKFERGGFKEFIRRSIISFIFYFLKRWQRKKFKLWIMESFIIQMLARVLVVDSFYIMNMSGWLPSARPPTHYAGEFRKTASSLSKRIKCFWTTLRRGNLKTQSSPVLLDLGIIRTGKSSFSKSSVFTMFSVYTKTHRRHFQFSPVWRGFSQSSVFFIISTD